MALTYDWKLTGLKKQNTNDLEHVIIGTNWRLDGTDEEGYVGSFAGATPFDLNEIESGSFVAYEQLTEELVLGWIKNVVSGSDAVYPHYWEHINEQINKHIDTLKWEKTEVGQANFPWSPISGSNIPDAPPV
jgi:hypothetical protein